MCYTEQLDALTASAIKDIIELHTKLIAEHGKPPMVVYPSFPEQKTDLYDMPVREFKTELERFSFKLSAIGTETLFGGDERYYVRGFSTSRRTYRRISLDKLDKTMLLEFTDHLKKYYKNL